MMIPASLAIRSRFPAVTKFAVLVALVWTMATSAPAASITLSADRDNTLIQQASFADTNFGTATGFSVGNINGSEPSIVSFATGPLATALNNQDFTVQSVILRLTATTALSVSVNPEVHAIKNANQNWGENTSTWNNKGGAGSPWAGGAGGLSVPGTDYEGTSLAIRTLSGANSITAGTQVDFTFDQVSLGDLHTLLSGWLAYGVVSNPGLLLFDARYFPPNNDNNDGGTQRINFASREHATSAWQPQLLIEYTLVPTPEPTSFGLWSIGLLSLMVLRRRSCSTQ